MIQPNSVYAYSPAEIAQRIESAGVAKAGLATIPTLVLAALADGAVAGTVMGIAEAKLALTPIEAFVRGILCNVLVCLAVWLCFGARTVSGKILAIVFPISGFVALGFEHSVANMYMIPAGWLAGSELIALGGYAANILVVTVGNVIGGGVLVALVYWLVYGKGSQPA